MEMSDLTPLEKRQNPTWRQRRNHRDYLRKKGKLSVVEYLPVDECMEKAGIV
jgi:hypothetical protein